MSNQNIKIKSSSESEIKQAVDDLITFVKEMPIESSDTDTEPKAKLSHQLSFKKQSLFNKIRYKYDDALTQMLKSDDPIESENQ